MDALPAQAVERAQREPEFLDGQARPAAAARLRPGRPTGGALAGYGRYLRPGTIDISWWRRWPASIGLAAGGLAVGGLFDVWSLPRS